MTTTSIPRKETSARKIAANRANGRKSKGPVTKAGKEKTRKNALKHGLFSKALPEEEHPFLVDREEYHLLIEQYTEDFDPRTQFETTLVECLAFEMMRLRHIHQLEVLIWEEYRPPEREEERIHYEIKHIEKRGTAESLQREIDLLEAFNTALQDGVKPAFPKADRELLASMIAESHACSVETFGDAGDLVARTEEEAADLAAHIAAMRAREASVGGTGNRDAVREKVGAIVSGRVRIAAAKAGEWEPLLMGMIRVRKQNKQRLTEKQDQWTALKQQNFHRHLEHFSRMELMNKYEVMVRRNIDRTFNQLRTMRSEYEDGG